MKKVHVEETNISLFDALNKSAESIGGKAGFYPDPDCLIIRIMIANQAGDDNSE